VRAVSPAAAALPWDDEGFAWIELTLDQGRSHGLIVGASFDTVDDSVTGEGRVLAVTSDQSTLLWRLQRYGEDMEVSSPVAGTALVTPAWRRAASDTFKLPGSIQQ
jgi:hypothetical protein